MTMRLLSVSSFCLLSLFSLASVACAPHVAHADPPSGATGEREANERRREAEERKRDADERRRDHDRDEERRDHAYSRASGPSSTVDEVRDAKPAGQIDVHEFSGTVHVMGWTQSQLKVHANVSGDCHVEVGGGNGDRIEVRLECTHGPGAGDMEIQVPQASTLEVRTMSAEIGVQGVSGPLRLQTVTGDIAVKGGASADIEARTTSGSIHIDAPSPQTHAQTVSGDVTITGARGKASVHTVSGDCKLTGGDFSDVRVETVSGDVSFTGGIIGSFEVATHSGDVGVHVPAATNADAELRSFSGDLVVDLGDGKKQSAEHELDAKIGAGGARLRARSFSGDVVISR